MQGRTLVRTLAVVLLALLLVGVGFVVASPAAFPLWETGSFFSSALVEVPEAIDFLALYIPSNPFQSLAGAVVPAIVLFSMFLGAGLMGVPGKESLAWS